MTNVDTAAAAAAIDWAAPIHFDFTGSAGARSTK